MAMPTWWSPSEIRARYKRLLANTTTPALKARLAAKAKEREDLGESLEHRENGEARLKRALARS
jgi:hypothetical protein